MEINPDFGRIRKAVDHEEPDRVPLCEALIDYAIQSRFLGVQVTSDDLAVQVAFWRRAGYDYVPLTVGMMAPGKVTKESAISRVIREVMLKDSPECEDESAWISKNFPGRWQPAWISAPSMRLKICCPRE
jgi:hypothetical protein